MMSVKDPNRPAAFRPYVPGMESPRNVRRTGGTQDADLIAGGPPHKQRKRPPPLPTSTFRLTCGLLETYRRTNPSFVYVGSIQNPRRVLTKDARPSGNHGLDNKSSDLILTVGDVLCGPNGGHRFRVLDMLGQGTFGQVVKCRAEWAVNERDELSPTGIGGRDSSSPGTVGTSPTTSSAGDELKQQLKKPQSNSHMVAVKIVKNKPAYFNQAKVEIKVLHKVSEELGPGKNPGDPGFSLIRLLYDFEYHHHLCMVFELMSVNLYELIKHQDFRGLPFTRVRAFCLQLLDALECLFKLGVIHCDLKPENILLENFGDPTTPRIKLIDLGSACYHDHVAFTYIQSRFYRAPEVLLGVKYSAPIDLWSLGCVAVELFMGLPVFPGVSAHNQLSRIVEMLGMPPAWMIEEGKKGDTYFVPLINKGQRGTGQDGEIMGDMEFDVKEDYFSTNRKGSSSSVDEPSLKKPALKVIDNSVAATNWRLKTAQEWAFENGLRDGPEKTKRYVKEKSLPGIILKCEPKRRPKNEPVENIPLNDLECFIDFCSGLLRLDPNLRWTAAQAVKHPFIVQSNYDGPFVPSLPTPEPEEVPEDLMFADHRVGDVGDVPGMEVELEDEEEEDSLKEEASRRIKPRAAPVTIAKPAQSQFGISSASTYAHAATAAAAAKSLGLSSSQQQRYKRKLSESHAAGGSVMNSPGTAASSLSSVLGSPITRPDVPYPIAHQSRWSDLGLLASPKVGPLGHIQYHPLLPPLDQLGSPQTTPTGGRGGVSGTQVPYGSSLPNHRSLLQQSPGGPGSDVHAFRRLDFQQAHAAAAAAANAAGTTTTTTTSAFWPFPGSYTAPTSSALTMGNPNISQQQFNRVSPAATTAATMNASSAVLNHLASSGLVQATTMPPPQQQLQPQYYPLQFPQQQQQQQQQPVQLSSSWGASTSPRFLTNSSPTEVKKRAESESYIATTGATTATNGVDPSNAGQETSSSVVVEKSLAKWAPFDKDEEQKEVK